MMQLFWKTVFQLLKMLKMNLPYDLEIPSLLHFIQEKLKHMCMQKIHTQMSIAAIFIISQNWKQPLQKKKRSTYTDNKD
jgi:hypothetical protein